MRKAEIRDKQTQSRPVVKQGKGIAFDSPGGKQIAQMEALAEGSPHLAAQRKAFEDIHNSPHAAQQRHQFDIITQSLRQAPIQRAMPSQDQFKEQTNAGIFATRDDLLKQIDTKLSTIYIPRDEDYLYYAEQINNGSERGEKSFARMCNEYRNALSGLKGLVEKWISSHEGDDSKAVAHRRGPMKKLLQEIDAELSNVNKPAEQHAQEVNQRAEAKKAAEKQEKERMITADEFADKAGVIQSKLLFRDIVKALGEYGALPEESGKDWMRKVKIQAIHNLMSLIDDAWNSHVRIAEDKRIRYEAGSTQFEKDARKARGDALGDLRSRCVVERKRLLTQEEYDDQGARTKNLNYSHQISKALDEWKKDVETPVAKEGKGEDEGWVDFA